MRLVAIVTVLALGGLVTVLAQAPPVAPPPALPVGVAAWAFDELTLHSGARFQGVILKEAGDAVEFQVVHRTPGRPTVTLTTSFTPREIASLKRLPAAGRAALQAKLAELDPSGEGERRRMEGLELTDAEWLGQPDGAKRYESERFTLISGTSDEVTRRAAVRLEQIYAAFARFFPPAEAPTRPTTVLLAGRAEDYRRLLGKDAAAVLNPAIYDPAANRVVCGSDLRQLDERLLLTRQKHRQERGRIDKYEADLRALYKHSKPELDRHLLVVQRERDRLREADRLNSGVFDKATKRLFALLYHEAFHSYIASSVYPPRAPAEVRDGRGPGELPRWLNEGLAQVFETAVVEAGELRVGHADAERLARAQALAQPKPGAEPGMVLSELLRAGKETFLAAHVGQQGAASRAYLTSWAVTFYLTFERRALGTPEFARYLAAINTGADPIEAFEAWVGQDLPTFEATWHDSLHRLRPDGTLAPKKPPGTMPP